MADAEIVEGYADLDQDEELSHRDVDAIANALQEWGGQEHELVFWLPDWLAAEKDLEPVEHSDRVFTGICDAETEKAWCINNKSRPGSDVWIPKSVARAFRRGGKIRIPQRGITDFGNGGESA